MLKWSFSLFFLIFITIFSDSGYIIDNYKINIDINDKNVYKVIEDIEVNFSEPRRGIYRVIPERFNGRTIKVSDLKTNVQTYVKNEGTYIYLRMGDPNRYITGLKDYILEYNYDLGWNRSLDYDEVYYNLIGNDWDTEIKRLEFSITLPKKFDASKINFTLGKYGSKNTNGVVYEVIGDTIKGYTTVTLKPNESVTIALPLPKGYFNFKSEEIMFWIFKVALYCIFFIIPIVGFYLWKKYSDKDKVIEVVEFFPPDSLTPTEIGYYMDGRIDTKDLTSLIFYWANKGYLKIEELKKTGVFIRSEFILIFLVDDIDSQNDFEKYMFKALASYKDQENRVRVSDLRESFYKYIEKTAELFEIDLVIKHKTLYKPKVLRIGNSVKTSVIFTIGFIFGYFYYFGFIENIDNLITIGLGLVSIITTLLVGQNIKAKTDYSKSILGRIFGFKRFLEVAEKNKLETLIEQNPSYFYDILPYTIVLGVSNVWSDKFKDLVTEPPNWYIGSGIGDAFILGAFMGSFNNSLSIFNDSISSAPKVPTNFGGGSSSMGGGSSGGGAGGGGGGSW